MTQQPASEKALIDALSAQLIELANTPEDHPGKAEIRAWAQANIPDLAQLPVAQLPFTSVAAYMLTSFGKINEAVALATASIRQHGIDRLCTAVIGRVRKATLRGAFDALFAKRSDMAKAQLSLAIDRLGDVADLVEERAALNLLDEIETINVTRAGRQPTDGRPTVIKLGVWGDSFIDSAGRNALSCCLAPGNVPALTGSGPVIIHIHTRRRHVERLRALAALRELERHARIEIQIIPEQLFIESHMWGMGFWNRTILAMVEYDSLMYARQIGGDLICLSVDVVMSDSYLKAAKDKLSSGHELFLVPALRVTDEQITPLLAPYRNGQALVVRADALYRLSLETLHPAVLQQFMRQTPQRYPADPHQFFFTRADGFSAHAFQWHPLALCARSVPENIGFDGSTMDCRLPSDVLVGKDRTQACYLDRNPPQEGYMVGLDVARGITTFGDYEVSPTGVARSLEKWVSRLEDFEYFEWLLRQPACYRVPPDMQVDLPSDCRDEDGAVDEIIRGIESLRPDIQKRIARYA